MEVTRWVIASKKCTEHVLDCEWSPRQGCLNLCLGGWMKREDYNRKVERRGELLTRILDAAVCPKKCEDQLKLTIRDLCTRVAKYIGVDGGISEHMF